MDFYYFVFEWTLLISICLFITVSLSYLFLTFKAYQVLKNIKKEPIKIDEEILPTVSLLIPFFNEQDNIIQSAYSFIGQEYPKIEIIFINDGSSDKGLDVMLNEFKFYPISFNITRKDNEPKIKNVYKSRTHDNLFLIDKENGGKSDALNAGISLSTSEYFCSVDGDSILKPDALKKGMAVFIEYPNTAAVGCTIQVINGSTVKDGKITEFNLPTLLIEKFQFLEYIRGFLVGRTGLEAIRSNLIVSGAFGLFKKTKVNNVLGYTTNHLGEDMDLIIKLHKMFNKEKDEHEIRFISESLCMTQVPYDLESLKKQRIRWQKGLVQSIFNDDEQLIFQASNRRQSWFIVPYFLMVDIFVPIFTLIGYVLFILGLYFNFVSITHILLFFSISIFYHTFLSLCALFLSEYYYSNKINEKQFLELSLVAFLENFGYRQLISIWRITAMIQILYQKKHSWGSIKRKVF